MTAKVDDLLPTAKELLEQIALAEAEKAAEQHAPERGEERGEEGERRQGGGREGCRVHAQAG